MSAAPTRIAMVAGEASGDTLGRHLMEALRARIPDAQFVGIGGPKMLEAGFDSWFDQEKLAVRGLTEVLRHYREIKGIRDALVARLKAEPPTLFVGIDAPDFNLGVEKRLKASGITTAHYVSPTVWAWRAGRIRAIREAVAHMLVLFPFEEQIYRDEGIPVSFVGHPLADMIPVETDRAALRAQLRLPLDGRVIALLPGSTQSELAYHSDLFIAAAKLILQSLPECRFLVPLATRETRGLFEAALYRNQANQLAFVPLFGHAQDAMTAADAVLVASGTATLEAALLGRPMIIAYRLSPLTFAIARRMVRTPWIGLPNILAGEFVVPEFLQDEATAENLAQAMLNLLSDGYVLKQLPAKFAAMHRALKRDAASQAANALLPLLGRAQPAL
jgi:lipid-A-disaccharide synthase